MQALQLELAVAVRTLVLIGGGEFSFGETREIDEFLVRSIPPGNRLVAFIPTASGSVEYGQHFGDYLRGIDPSLDVVNLPIYRGRDGRRQKHVATLGRAGLIYLGGGVTNALLGTFAGEPVEMAVREAAERGAVVAAIGAAASTFGIHTRDMRGVTPSLTGLGWLPGTVVETGFEPSQDLALRRLMSLPEVQLGVGIPSRTALVIRDDGSTDLIGEKPVAVYRKN